MVARRNILNALEREAQHKCPVILASVHDSRAIIPFGIDKRGIASGNGKHALDGRHGINLFIGTARQGEADIGSRQIPAVQVAESASVLALQHLCAKVILHQTLLQPGSADEQPASGIAIPEQGMPEIRRKASVVRSANHIHHPVIFKIHASALDRFIAARHE